MSNFTEKLGIKIEKNPPEDKLSQLGVRQWPKYASFLCPLLLVLTFTLNFTYLLLDLLQHWIPKNCAWFYLWCFLWNVTNVSDMGKFYISLLRSGNVYFGLSFSRPFVDEPFSYHVLMYLKQCCRWYNLNESLDGLLFK